MYIQILILILAIVALYFGAEFALDAAEKIGLYFGMSPLVIGLVLIGFGTSLPEFFVSQLACLNGEPEIAMGNIIGSNIANLFLIMGLSGLLTPLYIMSQDIRRQVLIHVLLTVFLTVIILYIGINPLTTVLLALFFGVYLWDTFAQMRKQRQLRNIEDEAEEVEKLEVFVFGKLLVGFIFLYFGGEYLVKSGTEIGKLSGIPAYVISAIFVAFGTSFPELVTALIACAKKKNTDLITGNIIGSNIFNVTFVMGSIGIYEVPIRQNYNVELGALMFAALFLVMLVMVKRNFHLWCDHLSLDSVDKLLGHS